MRQVDAYALAVGVVDEIIGQIGLTILGDGLELSQDPRVIKLSKDRPAPYKFSES